MSVCLFPATVLTPMPPQPHPLEALYPRPPSKEPALPPPALDVFYFHTSRLYLPLKGHSTESFSTKLVFIVRETAPRLDRNSLGPDDPRISNSSHPNPERHRAIP